MLHSIVTAPTDGSYDTSLKSASPIRASSTSS
jgi:hypothetical protein